MEISPAEMIALVRVGSAGDPDRSSGENVNRNELRH